MGTERPQAPPRLRVAVREYLSMKRSNTPISIADIRKRVRYTMPEIDASDDALGEMIAAEIIANHGNVYFDGRSTD